MTAAATTPTPRPAQSVPAWEQGDIVQIGRARWIIRILNGDRVELESSNHDPAIWWTTTLDRLPDPPRRPS